MTTRQHQAQTAKAQRRTRNAEREALRRAKQLAEDAEDRALLVESRAEGGEPIPWDEFKRRHNL